MNGIVQFKGQLGLQLLYLDHNTRVFELRGNLVVIQRVQRYRFGASTSFDAPQR